MNNYTPKGIRIEKTGDAKTIIKIEKKDLIFSDYLGICFICFGFCMWAFLLINQGFNEFNQLFSIVFLGMMGMILLSFLISFKEQQIIIISDEHIEINKNRFIFSSKELLNRKLIEKIDIKKLSFSTLSMLGIVVMFKFCCNLGYYEIPRIVHNGHDIYILTHYNKNIRKWIIDYLNDL